MKRVLVAIIVLLSISNTLISCTDPLEKDGIEIANDKQNYNHDEIGGDQTDDQDEDETSLGG